VTDVAAPTITGSKGIRVAVATPAGFTATALTSTSVQLSWSASPGAAEYQIQRRSASGGYTLLTTTAATSFTDTTATANAAFVYRVRAVDAGDVASPYSTPDVATTLFFTDSSLASGNTIRGVHVTELRQAVNAVRAVASLGAFAFTDAALGSVPAKAAHVQELRTALTQARAALALPAVSYADPSLVAGTSAIEAVHVTQLRTAVR
jgi:fibronectin type 3 domain-containing protein